VFLTLAYTVSIIDRMILSVLFVPIKAEFGLSDASLGLLGGLAFALFYATLGIPIARLADSGNRKAIIVLSLFIFSIMTVLSGLASGLLMLVVLRILVGVGEAGVNPASHSIMADYYPPARLSSAMAILMAGNSLGTIVGLVAGGIISQHFGWRMAFVAAGVPGIILALLMIPFFREPPRGTFATAPVAAGTPSIGETTRTLLARPAARYLTVALTLQATLSYGLAQWLPSFMVRSHGLDLAQAGSLLGLVVGPIGIAGTLLGGKLADRAAKTGLHRIPGLLALSSALAVPVLMLSFQMADLWTFMAVLMAGVFLANFYFGPGMALVQTLVQPRMRAVTAALILLSMNLFGLGLGPVVIGALSDRFELAWPGHGLGGALTVISLIGLASGYYFWLCSKALRAERG
jgi:predicted MFS family arabinose efflux permease